MMLYNGKRIKVMMKRVHSSQGFLITLRILVLFVIVLAALLIAGTIYAAVRPQGADPLLRIGSAQAMTQEPHIGDSINIFTGIGRLRIPLQNSATLILSIAFPYPSDDLPFSEELAVKIGEFRTIAGDYFSSLTADKLIKIDEEAAKVEILRRYNASLRLGNIHILYFNDLMILE
jgi:flagellar basal body-associated protein FliL